MKTNLYCIKDVVADEVILCGLCKTDGLFVRQNAQMLSRMNPAYMDDFVIYHIGIFTDSDMSVENIKPRVVDWNSYSRPEQKSE